MRAYKVYRGLIIDLDRIAQIEYTQGQNGLYADITLWMDRASLNRNISSDTWYKNTEMDDEHSIGITFNEFCDDIIEIWSCGGDVMTTARNKLWTL